MAEDLKPGLGMPAEKEEQEEKQPDEKPKTKKRRRRGKKPEAILQGGEVSNDFDQVSIPMKVTVSVKLERD